MNKSAGIKNYFIKPGYRSRLEPEYFDDILTGTEQIVHQPDIYPFAGYIARRHGCRYIIDVGCGRAHKLSRLHPEFSVIGIDFGNNYHYCRQNYTFGKWIEWDLQNPGFIPIEKEVLEQSLIICSDVIEHLPDPLPLLNNLRRMLEYAPYAILSTPERDLVRGVDDDGPPANPAHVREWNLAELQALVRSQNLNLEFSGLTCNNDRDLEKKTSLLVLGNNRFPKEAPPADFRVVAVMTAYNEADIIEPVLKHLTDQGISTYLIDNWSTDGTLDKAKKFLNNGLIGYEKFPADGPAKYYNWRQLLNRVEQVSHQLEADWLIHYDSDEERFSPWPELTLRDALYRVDRMGYNAVDFTLLQFKPHHNNYKSGEPLGDYFKYFQFGKRKGHFLQIKAWKNMGQKVSLADSGGHEARFAGRRVFPFKFLTRHYPIRSQQHGERKIFKERQNRWNPQEKAAGWHNQYDGIKEGHLFLANPETCLIFEPETFYREYLVERLSGIGVIRDQSSPEVIGETAPPLSNPPAAPSNRLCIAGMHRSGTSLLTRLLNKSGVYLGPEDRIMPPAPDNPEGFWEHLDFVEINDEILSLLGGAWDRVPDFPERWWELPEMQPLKKRARALLDSFHGQPLWGWKDPRATLTMPFWKSLMPDMKIILGLRHPMEVARSLQKRNGFSIEFGLNLWQKYMERFLADVDEREVLTVHFDALLEDPRGQLRRIFDWLGVELDAEKLSDAEKLVDNRLRHHRSAAELPPAFAGSADLYNRLCRKAGVSHKQIALKSPMDPSADVEKRIAQWLEVAAGNLDAAIRGLEELWQKNPDKPVILNELGVLYFSKGNADKALRVLREAHRRQPENITILKNMADIYLARQDLARAEEIHREILRQDPRDLESRLNLGALAYRRGDVTTAIGHFQEVLQIDPENKTAMTHLDILIKESESNNIPKVSQPEIISETSVTNGEAPLVSIIIPVFNQLEYTRNCLTHLFRNTDSAIPYEVIVVDNGSTDGTPAFFKTAVKQHRQLRYLRRDEPLGFARACNLGADAARGRYLLFLNNDTEPRPGWLKALLNFRDHHTDAGIVGAKLLYPDQTIQHAGIFFHHRHIYNGRHYWPYHDFRGVHKNHSGVSRSRETDAITGACLLMSSELFRKLGKFDESYGMYFEDIDLNMKVRREGLKIYYCAESEVVHYEGKSAANQANVTDQNLKAGKQFLKRWEDYLTEWLDARKAIKSDVVWSAPIFNPSGYASEAIHFAMGLEKYVPLNILHDNPLFSDNFIQNIPFHWKEQLFRLHGDSIKNPLIKLGKNIIFISHQPAHSFKKVAGADYYIGRTMFETDRLPDNWTSVCNAMDEIWVPSQFNYETFVKSGVQKEKIKIIPEAIDTDIFNPEAVDALELPDKAGFNFLSIFEWTERKGWDILLKAYFESFTDKDDVCLYLRTFILGNYDRNTKEIIEEKIDQLIRRQRYNRKRLPRYVILGEQLPFPDIPRLYKAADAFVLPSRGEGWGRPYMEAMSMGLPVIGTNWSGNTAFMTPENSYLIEVEDLVKIRKMEMAFYLGHRWAQPSKKSLKNWLQTVYQNPEQARQVGARARRDILENFSIDKVARVVVNRLKEIESEIINRKKVFVARPQLAEQIRARLDHLKATAQKAAVVWEGDQFVYHSLALVNRELTSRLLQAGHEISVKPLSKDQFRPPVNSPFRRITRSVNKALPRVDVHVRHTWPPRLERPLKGHWVMIQPWEFGSLPKEWVRIFTAQVDEMWVPSQYVRQVYIDSGIPAERVFVVPNGIDPQRFHPDIRPYRLKTGKKFKFLFVGGTIYRKGIDLLLKAYRQAFTRQDDVCLVIKDMGGDSFYRGRTAVDDIRAMQNDPQAPEIEYIDTMLTDEELAGLYTACDALVHPYRGEGFGLPILEAMACGIPPIVTNGGACLDFCNEETAYLVQARKIRLSEKKIGDRETVDYPWLFEVDLDDLEQTMRRVFRHPEEARQKGALASREARTNWTWEKSAQLITRRIDMLKLQPALRFYPEIQGELEKADKLRREGRFQDAAVGYRRILFRHLVPAALAGLAVCQYQTGQKKDGLALARLVLEINPNFGEMHRLLGRGYLEDGNFSLAEEHLHSAVRANPGQAENYLALLEFYQKSNQPEAAGRVLSRLKQQFGHDPAVQLKIADEFLRRNNTGEAIALLRDSLTGHRANQELWKKYLSLLKMEHEEQALIQAYQQYLSRFPDDSDAISDLGVVLWQNDHKEQALRFFERAALSNGKNPEHLKTLADAYLALENFDDGVKILMALIQKYPTDFYAYQRMAELYMENGDFDSAATLVRGYLEKVPQNADARNYFRLVEVPEVYQGYRQMEAGNLRDAEQLFRAALQKDGDNAAAQLGLASVHFYRQDFEQAEIRYREILNTLPDSQEALFHLARIYLMTHRIADFERLADRHADAFRQSFQLQKLLLEKLIATEELSPAAELAQTLSQMDGNDPELLLLRGHLAFRQQKRGEAERLYRRVLEMDPANTAARENLAILTGADQRQEIDA